MISFSRALSLILSHAKPLSAEKIAVERANGRVLARDVLARADLPSFDNSAMDGYAVRSRELLGASARRPRELRLTGVVPAGRRKRGQLEPGCAAAIMTGAPLPAGADAVIMRESARRSGGGRVKFFQAPKVGDWVRPRGGDVRRGERILKSGAVLGPTQIGLLAAQGIMQVMARRRPAAAVVSTGSELVQAASPLTPGCIHDSNGPALRSALATWGIACVNGGIVRDDVAALRLRLGRVLKDADVLIVTGGVSVGDFDYTKDVLESLGMRTVFWKVRIKPGKPLLFGVRSTGRGIPQLIFGLPGNPLSVMVCLEEFVRPALERMQGHEPVDRYRQRGRAVNGFTLPSERRQFLFCRSSYSKGGYQLKILRPQASHMLARGARADTLALPAESALRVFPGDILPFRFLDHG